MFKFKIFILALSILYAFSANAKELFYKDLPIEDTEISLLTADIGPDVYMLGGHSLLRIENKKLGIDEVINWGLFSFNSPDFVWNFIRGDLLYSVGTSPTRHVVQMYKSAENRTLWEEKLNLTPLQKKRVLEKCDFWLQEENMYYAYDLWYYNCSIIIRDIFHYALGEEFKNQYMQKLGKTMRDVGVIYYNNYISLAFASPFFTNSRADYKVYEWERFMLPVEARILFKESAAFTDDGQKIPDSKLLSETTTITSGYLPVPPSFNYSLFVSLGLLVFLVLLPLAGKMILPNQYLRFLGLSICLYSLVNSICGLLMLFAWQYTKHRYLHHNLNMLITWPVDFVLLIPGFSLLLRNRLKDGKAKRLLRFFIAGHIAASVFLLLFWAFGLVEQNLSVTYLYLVPPVFIFYWKIWKATHCIPCRHSPEDPYP